MLQNEEAEPSKDSYAGQEMLLILTQSLPDRSVEMLNAVCIEPMPAIRTKSSLSRKAKTRRRTKPIVII